MCLYVDIDETTRFKNRNKNKKFIWAWKVLTKKNNPPYFQFEFKIGKNIARGFGTPWSKKGNLDVRKIYDGSEINGGAFHVFRRKKTAQQWRRKGKRHGEKFIKVKCYMKDFVACSYLEACFTAITIKGFNYR